MNTDIDAAVSKSSHLSRFHNRWGQVEMSAAFEVGLQRAPAIQARRTRVRFVRSAGQGETE